MVSSEKPQAMRNAKQAGAIDATVQMAVRLLPSGMILCGVFLAACFISLSVGTSVGRDGHSVEIARQQTKHKVRQQEHKQRTKR